MTEPPIRPVSPPRKRRWHQYSPRTLLAIVLLVSIGMSWFAVRMQQAKKQKEAVAAIRRLGGFVAYDYQYRPSYRWILRPKPWEPGWLQRLLGDDFFARPGYVRVSTDACTPYLEQLPSLLGLELYGNQVTDATMERLEGLVELQVVSLERTRVTDAGMEHLDRLPQLRMLYVSGCERLTEPGITHLKQLAQLEEFLSTVPFTDSGLKRCRGMEQLRSLVLFGPFVTDVGLENLKGLAKLERLCLLSSGCTDAALAYLGEMKSLTVLDLRGSQISDVGLERLKGLTRLKELSVKDTHVTDDGVRTLQQALPNCKIVK